MSRLLIGGYGPPRGTGSGIVVVDVEPGSGRLVPVGSVDTVSPSALACRADGTVVFAVEENDPGAVHSFAWDTGDDAALRRTSSQASNGADPCHLEVHPDGRWLFVSNYSGASVAVLPIAADGTLQPASDVIRFAGHGPRTDRQDAAHPHMTTVLPSGAEVAVADLGTDQIRLIGFDTENGRFADDHRTIAARPGSGPRQVIVGHGGVAYVLGELDGSLTVIDLATSDVVRVLPAPDGTPSDNLASTLSLSPDGRRLYAAHRGLDALAVFDVEDPADPRPVALIGAGGRTPRHFAVTPSGLYVTCQDSDLVSSLDLDGRLLSTTALPTPTFVLPVPGAPAQV